MVQSLYCILIYALCCYIPIEVPIPWGVFAYSVLHHTVAFIVTYSRYLFVSLASSSLQEVSATYLPTLEFYMLHICVNKIYFVLILVFEDFFPLFWYYICCLVRYFFLCPCGLGGMICKLENISLV